MSPTNTFVHVTVRTRRCRVLLTSPELAPWWTPTTCSLAEACAASVAAVRGAPDA